MSKLTTVSPTPYAPRIAKVQQKKLVFIIDEAHRSTFGIMLRDIKKTYPRGMFFGFTGTPIKEPNAIDGLTTAALFGECLHKYTISEGIRDKNVLGFKPFKVMTFDQEDLSAKIALRRLGRESTSNMSEEEFAQYHKLVSRDMLQVEGDVPNSLYSEGETGRAHRANVVKDILGKWEKTSFRGRFHCILAADTIHEAIEYYRLLILRNLSYQEERRNFLEPEVFNPLIFKPQSRETLRLFLLGAFSREYPLFLYSVIAISCYMYFGYVLNLFAAFQ